MGTSSELGKSSSSHRLKRILEQRVFCIYNLMVTMVQSPAESYVHLVDEVVSRLSSTSHLM
jgi:hypothetical protein